MQWLVKPVKEDPSVALGPQLFKSKPALSSSAKDQERTASVRPTSDSTSKAWLVLRLLTCNSLESVPACRQHRCCWFCFSCEDIIMFWAKYRTCCASILCVHFICCAACHASFFACRPVGQRPLAEQHACLCVSCQLAQSSCFFSYGCEIIPFVLKWGTTKYCKCRQHLPWLEAEEDQADVLGVW